MAAAISAGTAEGPAAVAEGRRSVVRRVNDFWFYHLGYIIHALTDVKPGTLLGDVSGKLLSAKSGPPGIQPGGRVNFDCDPGLKLLLGDVSWRYKKAGADDPIRR